MFRDLVPPFSGGAVTIAPGARWHVVAVVASTLTTIDIHVGRPVSPAFPAMARYVRRSARHESKRRAESSSSEWPVVNCCTGRSSIGLADGRRCCSASRSSSPERAPAALDANDPAAARGALAASGRRGGGHRRAARSSPICSPNGMQPCGIRCSAPSAGDRSSRRCSARRSYSGAVGARRSGCSRLHRRPTVVAYRVAPDSLPPERRSPLSLRSVASAYAGLFRNRPFIFYSAANMLLLGRQFSLHRSR